MPQALPTKVPVTRSSTVMLGGGSPFAFAASTGRTPGGDTVLTSIAAGRVYLHLTMSPALTVPAAGADIDDEHTRAWLRVEWDASNILTAGTVIWGTEWPDPVYSSAERYTCIPLAEIADGALVQVVTGNIVLGKSIATGGLVFWAPSL